MLSRLTKQVIETALKEEMAEHLGTMTVKRAQPIRRTNTMGTKCPAAIQLWKNTRNEFTPFLDWDVEIRKIICTTNALKCLNPVTRSLDPTGRGKARWVIRWKAALNAFAITFAGRLTPTETN